jgi:RNA polymerase sigma-70 factor (ECF subfamily)
MENQEMKFEELYDAYWLEIKKFIFVQARRDTELTEDIFQNTWMNAYRYLSTIRDPGTARAWLYAIARNEAKRYFHERRVWLFPEGISAAQDDEGGTTLEQEDEAAGTFPEALADADLLKRLLGGLSDAEQQLILLRYAYDMSIKDIAEMYSANYNTLKSSIRRALDRLRAAAAQMPA